MTNIKDLIAKIKRMGKDGVFLYGADESLTSTELNALALKLEQAEKVIEQVGRECADIREGIRQGKVDVPIADNSFYAIEELIAELYR